jgi:hypothetical protein
MKQLSPNLQAQLVDAGCPDARVKQCATLSSMAVVECLNVYKKKLSAPTKKIVVRRLESLRKAFSALRNDPDGELAFSILQTLPGWCDASVEDKLAEVDRALQAAKRMMRSRPGPPRFQGFFRLRMAFHAPVAFG